MQDSSESAGDLGRL